MSITKLIADPKAAQIYSSLDTHVHPATLADDYLQAKLAGNSSLCLALECFIRDLARMHFNRPEVLQALSDMERYKAMRKPGTGAPKMLQDIAARIDADYAAGNFETLDDGRIRFSIPTGSQFTTIDGQPALRVSRGRLRVTCKNMPGAVALLSAKYRRGIGKSRAARYGSKNA